MPRHDSVGQADVLPLLRVAADAADHGPDLVGRRQHLIRGLANIVGGGLIACFEVCAIPGDGIAAPGSAVCVNGDPQDRLSLERNLYVHDPPDPTNPFILGTSEQVVTIRRSSVLSAEQFERSDHFQLFRRTLRTADQIYARVTLPGRPTVAIGINRHVGDRPFTDREVRLVHLFHEHAGRLYTNAPRPLDPRVALLAPRLRPVLKHLLTGDGEKQVAARLGLSRNTIHQYVKAIYRRLDVTSRAELMAQFLSR